MGTEGFERDLLNHKKVGMHGGPLYRGKETESVVMGKFLKSGKWGRCYFPTHPCPFGSEGKRKMGMGKFFK